MEPSEDRVRHPAQALRRGAHDVHDAPMGAAGEQGRLPPGGDDQILLVDKGVRPQPLRRAHHQPGAARLVGAGHGGKEGQLLVQPHEVGGGHDAALQLPKVRRKADIAGRAVLLQGVEIPEGVGVDVDLRRGVALAEGPDAAAVVIVSVREDGRIHRPQVDAQSVGVLEEAAVRPHVEEDLVMGRLDVQAQPVCRRQAGVTGGVFQQGDDLQGMSSSLCAHPRARGYAADQRRGVPASQAGGSAPSRAMGCGVSPQEYTAVQRCAEMRQIAAESAWPSFEKLEENSTMVVEEPPPLSERRRGIAIPGPWTGPPIAPLPRNALAASATGGASPLSLWKPAQREGASALIAKGAAAGVDAGAVR